MVDGQFHIRGDAANTPRYKHTKRIVRRAPLKPYQGALTTPAEYKGEYLLLNNPANDPASEEAMDARLIAYTDLLNTDADFNHWLLREIRVKFRIFTPETQLSDAQCEQVEALLNATIQCVAYSEVANKVPIPTKADDAVRTRIRGGMDIIMQSPQVLGPGF